MGSAWRVAVALGAALAVGALLAQSRQSVEVHIGKVDVNITCPPPRDDAGTLARKVDEVEQQMKGVLRDHLSRIAELRTRLDKQDAVLRGGAA